MGPTIISAPVNCVIGSATGAGPTRPAPTTKTARSHSQCTIMTGMSECVRMRRARNAAPLSIALNACTPAPANCPVMRAFRTCTIPNRKVTRKKAPQNDIALRAAPHKTPRNASSSLNPTTIVLIATMSTTDVGTGLSSRMANPIKPHTSSIGSHSSRHEPEGRTWLNPRSRHPITQATNSMNAAAAGGPHTICSDANLSSDVPGATWSNPAPMVIATQRATAMRAIARRLFVLVMLPSGELDQRRCGA